MCNWNYYGKSLILQVSLWIYVESICPTIEYYSGNLYLTSGILYMTVITYNNYVSDVNMIITLNYSIIHLHFHLLRKEAHFGHLYAESCPFDHDPNLITTGEGRDRQTSKLRDLPFDSALPSPRLIKAKPSLLRMSPNQLTHLLLHPSITREQDAQIFELLHLKQSLPLIRNGHSPVYILLQHSSQYASMNTVISFLQI